jgi:hypothetical protein
VIQVRGIPAIHLAELKKLDRLLLGDDGCMKLLPSAELHRVPHEALFAWCVFRARYQIPSTELVEFLRELIDGRSVIEIAAGNGDLGHHLGIRMTDSALQTRPEIRAHFAALGQKPTDPPPGVERIDANAAVRKYTPKVVVGAWVTQLVREGDPTGSPYGVDELAILRSVDCYIHIGNDAVHGAKRALRQPHRIFRPGCMFSRGFDPRLNAIYVWGC